MTEKPKDLESYKKWLKKEHNIKNFDLIQSHYEKGAHGIKKDFEESKIWIELLHHLKEYNNDYLVITGYDLLTPGFTPELKIKPFKSLLEKTFRKNILENKNWPHEPKNGWILPENWFYRINDIIRTLFIVKYLDGVDFIIDKIESHCTEYEMVCRHHLEAREEGYYAAHLYTQQNFEIPKIPWNTERVDLTIEIQITTQLQDVIRVLLHKYYEERRKTIKEDSIKWQWNYKSDEFITNYLGHILHYVEGMIMEIREKQKEEST